MSGNASNASHRDVNKLVLEVTAQHPQVLKAAIVSPNRSLWYDNQLNHFPLNFEYTYIKGPGRGPCSQCIRQLYELAKWTLSRKNGPLVEEGLSYGCTIHITDVASLFLSLFETSLNARDDLWGPEAYYLAENGDHAWGDVTRTVATIASDLGFILAPETEPLDATDVIKHAGYEAGS
ncbi:hypothetical protein BBP40_006171 [Aspergillus hancockii]|nr:hypothetical protein BBP40_006171 [Aspergillus hancockii]